MSTLGTVRLVLTADDGAGRRVEIEREHLFHESMDVAIQHMLGPGCETIKELYDELKAGK